MTSAKVTPGLAALLASACLLAAAAPGGAEERADLPGPQRNYYAYVCAESEDTVSLVRFGPDGAAIEKTISVGAFPAETEGPHGINVAPDGRSWFVSIAHGNPYGSIHRYTTGDDEWQGDARVGLFPATLDVSASTGLLYVVNSNFYGDHTPSTISVIETSTMTEVEQIATGTMPHGARLSLDGSKLYSVNMMDDELIEVDALAFEIARRLPLGQVAKGADTHANHGKHAGHAMKMAIEPSWVSPPTADSRIWVAALSGNQIIEVDLEAWEVTRRFETPKGPYNLAVSPDATLLVVTYKKSDAVGFWDLASGDEVARVDTTRRIPHGVAITADGRYSFVTVEGVGGEPGAVEIYDNQHHARVASVDIGKQAGGIAIWQGPGS